MTTGSENAETDWTVTVTEPLPNCPSVQEAWKKIATLTKWPEWRSESKMRGKGVVTTLVPPATEPLKADDEYTVHVGLMKIHCRVLESGGNEKMVFDSTGLALCGLVKARFRFTIMLKDGVVEARAQEKISSLACLMPPKQTLENEHRHTFKELNASFSQSQHT